MFDIIKTHNVAVKFRNKYEIFIYARILQLETLSQNQWHIYNYSKPYWNHYFSAPVTHQNVFMKHENWNTFVRDGMA